MLAENLLFKKFFVLYNIALPAMVVMMLIRGIVQVLGIDAVYRTVHLVCG